jgi:hypothetical protein
VVKVDESIPEKSMKSTNPNPNPKKKKKGKGKI